MIRTGSQSNCEYSLRQFINATVRDSFRSRRSNCFNSSLLCTVRGSSRRNAVTELGIAKPVLGVLIMMDLSSAASWKLRRQKRLLSYKLWEGMIHWRVRFFEFCSPRPSDISFSFSPSELSFSQTFILVQTLAERYIHYNHDLSSPIYTFHPL